MSITRCPGCERSIDIDTTDVEDVQIGEDILIMCVPCAMKHEEETLAYGRELAREHHHDLSVAGCTCHWADADSRPVKRNQDCPMHGGTP